MAHPLPARRVRRSRQPRRPPVEGRRPIVGVLVILIGMIAGLLGGLSIPWAVAARHWKSVGGSVFLTLLGVVAVGFGAALCRGSKSSRRRARRMPRRFR